MTLTAAAAAPASPEQIIVHALSVCILSSEKTGVWAVEGQEHNNAGPYLGMLNLQSSS